MLVAFEKDFPGAEREGALHPANPGGWADAQSEADILMP